MLQTIEEKFLEECNGKDIKVILRNGFQMRGRILDSDEEVIILESHEINGFETATKKELVYKDYVSTIVL